MGLFDFFKKKPKAEAVEEIRQEAAEAIEEVKEAAANFVEEVKEEIAEAKEEIAEAVEDVKEFFTEPEEEEIEIEFFDEEGETLRAETEEEAEAVLEELTDMAGEILAEKPLLEDEIVVSLEDGEVFTADSEEEAEAVLAELADMAGEILAEKPLEEDEVVVSLEDGEVFTADREEDAIAFVEELAHIAEEMAEETNKEVSEEETPAAEEVSEEVPAAEEAPAAEEVPAEEAPAEEKPEKKGFFAKLKAGLDKTRKNIMGGVDTVLGSFTKIDEDLFEELEEALIMADMGVQTTMDIVENLRKRVKKERTTNPAEIKDMLIDEIRMILEEGAEEEENLPSPTVMLVIGVNGVGKTTTIGKLAHNFKEEGKSVLLAAADTFRAAAIDQLEVWGERSGIEVIKHAENTDPAAVVYDAVHAARGQKADLLICDTAGRLHNKKNLMEELRKIARIIEREHPNAHKEVYLVLDATTGQNALQQAKLFREVADITGIILTKLDGTAKGGIVVAIKSELKIPVRYIGVGEGIHDLQKFDAAAFAGALFGKE